MFEIKNPSDCIIDNTIFFKQDNMLYMIRDYNKVEITKLNGDTVIGTVDVSTDTFEIQIRVADSRGVYFERIAWDRMKKIKLLK